MGLLFKLKKALANKECTWNLVEHVIKKCTVVTLIIIVFLKDTSQIIVSNLIGAYGTSDVPSEYSVKEQANLKIFKYTHDFKAFPLPVLKNPDEQKSLSD